MERYILLALPFILGIVIPFRDRPLPPTSPKPPDWQGYYALSGQENDKTYNGVVMIRRANQVYLVTMVAGPSVTHGIGQERSGLLAIAWKPINGGGLGCTVLVRQKGQISSSWAAMSDGGKLSGEVRTETLTWLRKLDD